MNVARSIIVSLLFAAGIGNGEETVIHRCTQDDGTVAFQETPCPEPVESTTEVDESHSDGDSPAPADEFFEFVNPFDEEEETVTREAPAASEPPSLDRSECEKTTRAAIDAIDADLQNSDSPENDRQHLADLLELTRQLRACKTL